MVIRIWPTRKLGLDFDLEIDSRSCVISWLRVVITCRINVIVPCSFFLLLSGNLQIIFGLAISPHCLQTISKYFGNFYFYEAVTLTLKKRLLDRNSIKSNFRRQKHQNFWIYDTKHGRHIFEKSKKKCNKRNWMKKNFERRRKICKKITVSFRRALGGLPRT